MSEGNGSKTLLGGWYRMTRQCDVGPHRVEITMEPEPRPWEDLAAKMLKDRLSSLDAQLRHLLDVLPDDWQFKVVQQGPKSWVEVRPPSSDGWQTVAEGRAKREEVDHE